MLFQNRCLSRLLPMVLLLSLPLPAECKDSGAMEKKLTKRVDGFYRSFVTGEWSKITPFVSEDTRPIWLGVQKSTIISYKIDTLEVAPGGKTAKVSVMVTNRFPQAYNASFTQTQRSEWIYQKGDWFVKIRPRPSLTELFKSLSTSPGPAVPMTPPIAFEQNPVQFPIRDDGADSVRKVYFQVAIPVAVVVQNLRTNCDCLKAELDRTAYEPTGDGVLTLTYHATSNNPPNSPLVVEATIAPLGYQLSLPVVLEIQKP
jgi:hypothetical protein